MSDENPRLKKIDDPNVLRTAYSKRREGIIKKIKEISASCDDSKVGLLMFSPTGKLTCVSTTGRIEDIFLSYLNQTDEFFTSMETEECIYQRLKRSKYEGEMLQLIETKETLERRLMQLNRQQVEAEQKLRFYEPDMRMITSIENAVDHENYLKNEIQRIRKMREKLLDKEHQFNVPNPTELQSGGMLDGNGTATEPVSCTRMRNPSMNETWFPTRGTDYPSNQSVLNFPSGGSTSSSTPRMNFNEGDAFQGFGK